jgi:hypothetical protein
MPINASKPVWRSGHVQEDFWERLIKSPVGCLNLAGARPPALTAKLSKPRCPPAGLYFWSTRAAGWLVEPNVLKSDFDTIVGLEARAVTESKTEAERLREHARRSLELARDIADQEAARALKAYALISWKGQRRSERDGQN